MNTFATLELFTATPRVNFYTVRLENEDGQPAEETITDRFFTRMCKRAKTRKLTHLLLSYLIDMGNRGASAHWFRPEYLAHAVPSSKARAEYYVRNDLRLYCVRLDRNIVVLFSGDLKTAATVKECPNVRPHFHMANHLARKLKRLLKRGKVSTENGIITSLHHQPIKLKLPNGFNYLG